MRAQVQQIAVGRARVTRVTGEREVHYSIPSIPFWQVRRRIKLWRHLRFMRNEDRRAGWR